MVVEDFKRKICNLEVNEWFCKRIKSKVGNWYWGLGWVLSGVELESFFCKMLVGVIYILEGNLGNCLVFCRDEEVYFFLSGGFDFYWYRKGFDNLLFLEEWDMFIVLCGCFFLVSIVYVLF